MANGSSSPRIRPVRGNSRLEVARRAALLDEDVHRGAQAGALVANSHGKILGQIGHLDVLQAMEPRQSLRENMDTLSKAGVSGELMGSLLGNLNLWEGQFDDICARAASTPARDIMRPLQESLDVDSSLVEAMRKLVVWQTPRALVTRSGTVVGIVRLADLIDKIALTLEK